VTDAELVRQVLDGDRRAFGALVDRYHMPLLRLARSFVKSQAVAEEAVQDTWAAALEGLAGFEGRSSLKTWLYRILANRATTLAVREGRSTPFSALGTGGGQGPGQDEPAVDPDRFDASGHWRDPPARWSEESPEKLALDAETGALLSRAIEELPAGQRAVITLRDVEGMEAEEICNVLGITLTNQRVLLHRARARVRRALEQHLARR
jgi:RNA polymerase sigma-70 factor, ECF subfamily